MEVTRRNAIKSAAVVGAVATAAAAPTMASADAERSDTVSATSCTWSPGELADRRRVIAAGMTEDEADAWLLIARVAGKFFNMPELHPAILPEVVTAIHVIQDKLLMRPTYRKYRGFTASAGATAYAAK